VLAVRVPLVVRPPYVDDHCFMLCMVSAFHLMPFPKLSGSFHSLQQLRSTTSQIKLELKVVVNQEVFAALRVEVFNHYCQPLRAEILLHARLMFQLHVLVSLIIMAL
jgi:hypothetical protein